MVINIDCMQHHTNTMKFIRMGSSTDYRSALRICRFPLYMHKIRYCASRGCTWIAKFSSLGASITVNSQLPVLFAPHEENSVTYPEVCSDVQGDALANPRGPQGLRLRNMQEYQKKWTASKSRSGQNLENLRVEYWYGKIANLLYQNLASNCVSAVWPVPQ